MFGKLFCRLHHPDLVVLNQRFPPDRHEQYRAAVRLLLSIWWGDNRRLRQAVQEDVYRWLLCLAPRYLKGDRRPYAVDAVHDLMAYLPEVVLVSTEKLNPNKPADLSAYLGCWMYYRVTNRARRAAMVADRERMRNDTDETDPPDPVDFRGAVEARRQVERLSEHLEDIVTERELELARRLIEFGRTLFNGGEPAEVVPAEAEAEPAEAKPAEAEPNPRSFAGDAAKHLGVSRQRIYRLLEKFRKWLEENP